MSKIMFALAACALLTRSAASAEQRAAERAALINLLKARCMEFGYKPGTGAFAACMNTMAPTAEILPLANALSAPSIDARAHRALMPFQQPFTASVR